MPGAPLLALLLIAASPLFGQSVTSNARSQDVRPEDQPSNILPLPELPGAIEVATESFIAGPANYSQQDTAGVAIHVRQYLNFGSIDANLEGFDAHTGFREGKSYFELNSIRWHGGRFLVRAGDFFFDSHPVRSFANIVADPFLIATGLQADMERGHWTVTAFAGAGAVTSGTRIPLRYSSGQWLEGLKVKYQPLKSLAFGFRAVNFSAEKPSDLVTADLLPSAWTTQFSGIWEPGKHWHFYGEAGMSNFGRTPSPVSSNHLFSRSGGLEWDSKMATVQGYYLNQSSSAMPVAGYLPTGRDGWFGSVQLRPTRWLAMFSSASDLKLDFITLPLALSRTRSRTAGVSASLPGRLSISGQYSVFANYSNTGSNPITTAATVSIARPFGRQSFRAELTEIDSHDGANFSSNTREIEADDNIRLGRFSLMGGVRLQTLLSQPSQTGLYGRGMAQFTISHVSIYAYVETGSDHYVKSGLMTQVRQTSNAGVRWDITPTWTASADAIYSSLGLTGVTAAVIAATTGAPISVLYTSSQWYMSFKISHRFSWGGSRSIDDVAAYSATHSPLIGAIEGQVVSQGQDSSQPVTGVGLLLDGWVSATTDESGRYSFQNVPQGGHRIVIDDRRLPADYQVADNDPHTVFVAPQGRARADFFVRPLAGIEGTVVVPQGIDVRDLVVRASPGAYWTTPDSDGRFVFENLLEGAYELSIDPDSLPPDTKIVGDAAVTRSIGLRRAVDAVKFEIVKVEDVKPVKIIPLQ